MNPEQPVTVSWTEDIPHCQETGLGDIGAVIYKKDGSKSETHGKRLDYKVYCCFENGFTLYGIFTGHNGPKVAEFALQTMLVNIAFCKHSGQEDEIKNLLKQAFIQVEKQYYDLISIDICKRTSLLESLPKNLSEYEISLKYKNKLDELSEINNELNVGASVVLALIHNSKLYIGNIGTCRALLCKNDDNNVLRVTQLTMDHDLNNPDEEHRMKLLGLDVNLLKQTDAFFATRCIGNYMGKAGYKESTYLSAATSEPLMSAAEFEGPILLDESCRFLVLMSKGLCKSLVDIFQVESSLVNKEIVQFAVEYFRTQTSLMSVAQSVINKISLQHYEAFMESQGKKFNLREDMTLLIRNFNYPLPLVKRPSQCQTTSEKSSVVSETLSSNSTNSSDYGTQEEARASVDPYVDFTLYHRIIAEAKANGTLPDDIEFE